MKILFLVLFGLMLSYSPTPAKAEVGSAGDLIALCFSNWPGDYNKQSNCISEETAALYGVIDWFTRNPSIVDDEITPAGKILINCNYIWKDSSTPYTNILICLQNWKN